MEYFIWKIRNGFVTAWLAFCFIVTISTIIIYFTIDESKYYENRLKKNETLKFKTLLNNNEPLNFKATWFSDDEILTQDEGGNIILYDVNKSIRSVLAFNSMQHMKNYSGYSISADKKYLLIAYEDDDTEINNKFMKMYDIINVKSGKQVTLRDTHHDVRKIMAAQWSPIDSSLVIVDNYNIYYIPTVAKPNHAKQITFHGSNNLHYGLPDWVYKEEIFASDRAMWFSKQGTKLAYASFNETLVPMVYLSHYGIPSTMYDQYEEIHGYHYPKVNDPNPTVELFVQILNIAYEFHPISIKPVKNYSNETILYNVMWSGDDDLFVMWMNRFQNESHLAHYYISNNTAEIKELFEFRQENGWLNFKQSFLINPEHQVVLIYPVEQDDGNSFGHVAISQSDGKIRSITNGKYEVTELIKWDFELNYIYYFANTEGGSEKQHMYRVLVDMEQNHVEPECLTCTTECTFNYAVLSEKNTYYAHICYGPNIPYVNIMKTGGDKITAWETNKKLNKELENVNLPKVLFLTVPLVDDYEARVKLLIPPNVTISPHNKYPLLIFTYGGPSINVALDKFEIDLNMYLSSNHDIIVAKVDGRGTSRQGRRTLFSNYLKLGTNEVDDQIIVSKYLKDTLSYVDETKIGIWGWSFGGFVAGMVLAKDEENLFKCALSVAPITNWIYYDSMYTERLMGSYKDNFESYQNASLIENAEKLRHKKYMIIHGLFDTNVHFQHSAMLSKQLQKMDIPFSQQFYPDESHLLENVKKHLYRTINLFILKYLA